MQNIKTYNATAKYSKYKSKETKYWTSTRALANYKYCSKTFRGRPYKELETIIEMMESKPDQFDAK